MDDPVCGEIHLPGVAIKMSATPGRVGPVPTAGQHTDEVLSGLLGYDEALLDDLRQAKAIA
jgi:crotonobetainyl-CoA:carnitine CoA-transferase CaiB-like acyl-CoA transferase